MYDVVVVGGGPAGSATAAFLARAGRKVVVLEREHFPRFHVGESLLPASVPILRRLGVVEQMEAAGFQRKWGAQFIFRGIGRRRDVEFAKAVGAPAEHTWQVRRADFDHLLLRHAASLGAEVREGVRVERVRFEGERAIGVDVVGPDGRAEALDARVVVDATGRDALMGAQMGLRERDPDLRQAALYAHFSGPGPGLGREGGDILIVASGKTWFWLIPLDQQTTSVGIVLEAEQLRNRGERTLETFFDDLVANTPEVAELLARAGRSTQVYPAADFSYRMREFGGDGWVSVGDASAFLDPVFSSGVHIALQGAELGARTIDKALDRAEGFVRADAVRYAKIMRRGLDRFRRFIVGFYDPAFVRVFGSKPPLEFFRHGVVSVLAGRVFDRHPGIKIAETGFLVAVARERRLAANRAARRAQRRPTTTAEPTQRSAR